MCLKFTKKDMEELDSASNIAYKVLIKTSNGTYLTPYIGKIVNINRACRAMGKVDILLSEGVDVSSNESCQFLHGGAIHCFRTKEDGESLARKLAYNNTLTYYTIHLFRVEGKGKIACNSEEIAFLEIEFLEECEIDHERRNKAGTETVAAGV